MTQPVALACASLVAYAALTSIIGWPVIRALDTAIASDPGDPVLNAAILTWNATRLPFTDAWYQFPIFYPTRDALTFSEHLLGVSVLATPVYWVTGSDLAAYNVALLLSYPLSGLAMYLLAYRLTRSPAAAFLSGLAFAFAPYRTSQLPHIQMLTVFWTPLALFGLHIFLETRRLRWLALFAVSWLLQGAANGYFLVFLSVFVALWVLWFCAGGRRWRDAALVLAAMAVAVLPLVPILSRYVASHRALGLRRNLGEIALFGADIAAPLCAPVRLSLWGWLRLACEPEGELFAGVALLVLCCVTAIALLLGTPAGHASAVGHPRTVAPHPPTVVPPYVRTGGHTLVRVSMLMRRAALAISALYLLIAASVVLFGPWRFAGAGVSASASGIDKPLSTACAALLVALLLSRAFYRVVRRGSTPVFYASAAVVCWVLSWGPFPRLFGQQILYQAPFAWLLTLPGVDGLRVPARFWMLSVLCLAVFIAFGVRRLLAGRSRLATTAFVAVAAAALMADGWVRIPAAAVGQDGALQGLEQKVVLRMPPGDVTRDVAAGRAAVRGGWSTINGFSGYEPPYYEALRTLAAAGDGRLMGPFLARQELRVLVDEDDLASRALVERQDGVQRLAAIRPGLLHYAVPAQVSATPGPVSPGRRLRVRAADAACSSESARFVHDLDVDTRWVCGVQDADQAIVLTLEAREEVATVVHVLGPLGADFPRLLTIETSLDGVTWQPGWEGSPAALVLRAALDAPLETRVVLRFAPRAAAFVRLRQRGRDHRNYWSAAEIEVWSPR